MPTFDFPMLVWWGIPLAAAPLVIHLINLLRHKRVRFPAVEFLLASQKKYRSRVLLREWLLLALRTAAVLGVVFAAAQPRWHDALGRMFGAGGGRHVILIDDSYSMQDRSLEGRLGETTAFDRARAAVAQIMADLGDAAGPQEVSIGRFSAVAEAAGAALPDSSEGTTASPEDAGMPEDRDRSWDIRGETLSPQALPVLRAALERLAVGWGADGPAGPLAGASARLGRGGDERELLWIISDFRARDWATPAGADQALRRLAGAGVGLRFVACGPETAALRADNLSIERLSLSGGVPAVGVLVPLELEVRNDGPGVARNVPVSLREDGASRAGLQLAEIPAGGTATARFDVRFTAAGGHLVEAELPGDAVAADNRRGVVIDVVERADVLVIDGDPRGGRRGGDVFYVAAALAPGQGAATGLRPRIEPPRALAQLDLPMFHSVWILDCERLDPAEITALEDFTRAGGGVVFFTGPRTDPQLVNQLLHRDGAGLFPVPLAGAVDLPAATVTGTPDIQPGDHPVVAVLAGQRNPLLDAVRIERVMTVPRDAPADPAVRRLLSLRTAAPLIVERPFGKGTVAAVLTTAAPAWNNWARGNPSWVVLMLELEAHLARGRRQGGSHVIGGPLTLRLPAGSDPAEVDFAIPDGTLVRQAATAMDGGGLEATLPRPATPGGYTARWRGSDGTVQERLFAVNVNPDEGRLEPAGEETVRKALEGVAFDWLRADALASASPASQATSIVRPLLFVLAAVLVGEQLLALLAGYHPPSAPARVAHARSRRS
jgi:hypothetical protein